MNEAMCCLFVTRSSTSPLSLIIFAIPIKEPPDIQLRIFYALLFQHFTMHRPNALSQIK